MVNRDRVKTEALNEIGIKSFLGKRFLNWLDEQPAEIDYKVFSQFIDEEIKCFGQTKEVRAFTRAMLSLSIDDGPGSLNCDCQTLYSDKALLSLLKDKITQLNANLVHMDIWEYEEYAGISIEINNNGILIPELGVSHDYIFMHHTTKDEMIEKFTVSNHFRKELLREKVLIKKAFPKTKVSSYFRY